MLVSWNLENKVQWNFNKNKLVLFEKKCYWKCRLQNVGNFVSASVLTPWIYVYIYYNIYNFFRGNPCLPNMIQGTICYTVSHQTILFHTPQTRCEGGLRSRKASYSSGSDLMTDWCADSSQLFTKTQRNALYSIGVHLLKSWVSLGLGSNSYYGNGKLGTKHLVIKNNRFYVVLWYKDPIKYLDEGNSFDIFIYKTELDRTRI